MAPSSDLQKARARMLPAMRPSAVAIAGGEGLYVWDDEGRRLLDLAGGLSGNLLGHDAAPLVRAAVAAARAPMALPDDSVDPSVGELSAWLVEHSFADRVVLARDPAEARRFAFDLLARYRLARSEQRDDLIIVGAGEPEGRHEQGVQRVAPGAPALAAAALSERTSAVVYAPSLAAPASVCPGHEELQELQELARAGRALFVVDETELPWARSGRLFTWEGGAAVPDLAIVGAGMAAGAPFGAVLVGPELARFCARERELSVRRAAPLSAALALATLRHVHEEGLLAAADNVSRALARQLEPLARDGVHVREVTSVGLLHVLTIDGRNDDIVDACRQRGLLLGSAGDDTLLVLAPLALQRGHVKAIAAVLRDVLLGDG